MTSGPETPQSAAMKKLMETPIRFGLRNQGHYDTVVSMLADGYSWTEIGRAIGWSPEAAERFYEAERLR